MYEFVYALLTKRKCFKKNRKCVFGWHKPGMALTKNGTHCLFGAFCLLKIKTLAFIYFFSSIDSTNSSDDKSWFCLSFSLIFYYFVISFLFVLNSTAVHAEYCCMIVKVRKSHQRPCFFIAFNSLNVTFKSHTNCYKHFLDFYVCWRDQFKIFGNQNHFRLIVTAGCDKLTTNWTKQRNSRI